MKIFRYECRRIMGNRIFAGLLLVVLLYGWQVLTNVTILGVRHTAPFSPWSFGDYLSRMLPLLWAGEQLFLTAFTSPKARRAAALTDVLLDSPRRYALIRQSAGLAGTMILGLAVFGEGLVFYGLYFHWYEWKELLPTFLLVLVPVLVFGLGSGWLLGQVKPWLGYGWMLVPFLRGVIPLPVNGLDLGFVLPEIYGWVQGSLLAGGLCLSLYLPGKSRKQKKQRIGH